MEGQGDKPKRQAGHDDHLDRPARTWVELWSVARYDLGLDWEEFADLTPSMFLALQKRRGVRLKHERFASGLTAAAVYNASGMAGEAVSAYDFVRDAKQSEAHEQRQTLKRQILHTVQQMPANTTREKFLKLRSNIIAQLEQIGRTDAEELWAECWPSIVPQEGE